MLRHKLRVFSRVDSWGEGVELRTGVRLG